MTAPRLYHFTCAHAAPLIGTWPCVIEPQATHPILRCRVVWFTTEAVPDRAKTGLTMKTIPCDRMAYRYFVLDTSPCRPWLGSPERDAAPRDVAAELEDGCDPEHWWIADGAVRAARDTAWRGAPERVVRGGA